MHLDLAGLNPVITWSGIDRTKAYLSSNLDIIAFLGSRTWVRRNGGRQFQSASAKLSRKRLGFFSGYKPSKLYIATPSICVILTKLVFQGQEFKRHLGQWQQGDQHLFILYYSLILSYSLFCFSGHIYSHYYSHCLILCKLFLVLLRCRYVSALFRWARTKCGPWSTILRFRLQERTRRFLSSYLNQSSPEQKRNTKIAF